MKMSLVVLVALIATACGREGTPTSAGEQPTFGEQPVFGEKPDVDEDPRGGTEPSPDQLEVDSDEHILSPEELGDASTQAYTYRFAQTKWGECIDPFTGNFSGYACSNNRNISVMLKNFMGSHMKKCVDAGLAAQGGGRAAKFHVIHAGITGDPNHSPRSLHAENRAIDIKSLAVTLTTGAKRTITYAGTTNRAFYTAFRYCWGQVVKQYNGCPYMSSGVGRTGSIGWENSNHQYHLHTSIPYCVSGRYGSYYYTR